MAQINQEQSTGTNSGRPEKKVTHFINLKVATKNGEMLSLGSLAITDKPTKLERTLLAMLEQGADLSKVAVLIDIRANVPSTDTFDINDLLVVEEA